MSTLTRYLIRLHVAPFLFALSAVTSLLFLTAMAERFGALAGKGLGLGVVGKLMLLSLPSVVTLAVPMALFVASLYVFADLVQHNECSALMAGGVHPGRLIAPLAVLGLGMSLVMLRFNDRVLPDANARYFDLLEAIGRKSPTLALQTGTLNEVRTADGSRYYLLVRSVAPDGNLLRGVVLIDLSNPLHPNRTTARSATVAQTPDGRDLVLEFRDGTGFRPSLERPGAFTTFQFREALVPLRGMAASVVKGARAGPRSDRELSISALHTRVRAARSQPQGALSRAVIISGRREIYRRYATAFACVVFLLLGPPLAMRFAEGGIGMVIALSVFVTFFFRVGIIWGDRLADSGRVDPLVGSWGTTGILLIAAILLLSRFGAAGWTWHDRGRAR